MPNSGRKQVSIVDDKMDQMCSTYDSRHLVTPLDDHQQDLKLTNRSNKSELKPVQQESLTGDTQNGGNSKPTFDLSKALKTQMSIIPADDEMLKQKE